MREELEKIEEVRTTFTGTFVRGGLKSGYMGYLQDTVLLRDIHDSSGKILTDHLWFNLTKGFAQLGLKEDDVIQFDARVKEYYRGYFGRREDIDKPVERDYKLSHPTKIRKIADGDSKEGRL